MKIYVWVSKDKYQLPLYVATSIKEMANVSGYTEGSIHTIISKGRRKKIENPSFICVEVQDAED